MKWLVLSAVMMTFTPWAQGRELAQSDTNLEGIFNRAAQAMQAGEYAQAEAGFRQVLAADANNLAALGNLGVLYARTHRFTDAIAVDQLALKLNPEDKGVLLNLGLAYLKQEDYARAQPYLERLDARGTGGTRAAVLLATSLVMGNAPQRGLDLLLSRKLELSDPSALYLEAVAYARLGQTEAGEKIFAQLLSGSSTRAQASFLLGQALHDGHRLQEAADSFQQTLQRDPAYPGAHRELGKVYISMQHFPDAERELRAAIAQDSKDGSALYFLGALLVQSARPPDGVPYLLQAQALLPDSWAIPFYLGKADLSEHHADAAIAFFRQAASMNANEPQVFYLLALALRASGQNAEAKAAMDRVAALHSTALDVERQAMQGKIAGAH